MKHTLVRPPCLPHHCHYCYSLTCHLFFSSTQDSTNQEKNNPALSRLQVLSTYKICIWRDVMVVMIIIIITTHDLYEEKRAAQEKKEGESLCLSLLSPMLCSHSFSLSFTRYPLVIFFLCTRKKRRKNTIIPYTNQLYKFSRLHTSIPPKICFGPYKPFSTFTLA